MCALFCFFLSGFAIGWAGVGGVRGEEHGDERPPADAGISVLREENEDTVRQGDGWFGALHPMFCFCFCLCVCMCVCCVVFVALPLHES